MKNLTTAIFEKMTPATTLYSDIGGRLYKKKAPQGAEFPYVTFFVVTDVPEYPSNKTIEWVLVQFSIFSSASGTTEAEDILTHLRSLYDDCTLSITNNTLIYFIRGNFIDLSDDSEGIETISGTTGVWHYMQEYNISMVGS